MTSATSRVHQVVTRGADHGAMRETTEFRHLPGVDLYLWLRLVLAAVLALAVVGAVLA